MTENDIEIQRLTGCFLLAAARQSGAARRPPSEGDPDDRLRRGKPQQTEQEANKQCRSDDGTRLPGQRLSPSSCAGSPLGVWLRLWLNTKPAALND